MNLLVSAFACRPGRGSEPGVGWNYVKQIASFCDTVTVLTSIRNREVIEAELVKHPLINVDFEFITAPRVLPSESQKTHLRLLYYYAWQINAYRIAKRILDTRSFDLAHHVTIANDWLPTYLSLLSTPLIWGPVGGSNSMIPSRFFASIGFRGTLKEIVRESTIRAFRTLDPMYRHTLKKASRILSSNHDTFAAVPKKYQSKTIVHSQVGTHSFPADTTSGDPSNVHIVYGGLFQYLKGITYAVRSFISFNERVPNARLTLIGQGPEKARIEALVASSPHPERIQILSWIPQEQFHGELRKADVLLFPSFHDSGGLVVVEAMAMGIPVICLDRAGPAFLVSDTTGIKVPIHSPAQVHRDLTHALYRLCTDCALRKRMGEAARERVQKNFLWERKADQLTKLYQSVLQNTKRPT